MRTPPLSPLLLIAILSVVVIFAFPVHAHAATADLSIIGGTTVSVASGDKAIQFRLIITDYDAADGAWYLRMTHGADRLHVFQIKNIVPNLNNVVNVVIPVTVDADRDANGTYSVGVFNNGGDGDNLKFRVIGSKWVDPDKAPTVPEKKKVTPLVDRNIVPDTSGNAKVPTPARTDNDNDDDNNDDVVVDDDDTSELPTYGPAYNSQSPFWQKYGGSAPAASAQPTSTTDPFWAKYGGSAPAASSQPTSTTDPFWAKYGGSAPAASSQPTSTTDPFWAKYGDNADSPAASSQPRSTGDPFWDKYGDSSRAPDTDKPASGNDKDTSDAKSDPVDRTTPPAKDFDSESTVSVTLTTSSTINLATDSPHVRMNVVINNYDARDGYWYLRISNGGTVLADGEFRPRLITSEIARTEVGYLIDLHSNANGTYTARVYSENGPSASLTFVVTGSTWTGS